MARRKLDNNYFLITNKIQTGTNYNISAQVFRKGDKLPLFGTVIKGTEPISKTIAWAKGKIDQRNSDLDKIFKEMDELGI